MDSVETLEWCLEHISPEKCLEYSSINNLSISLYNYDTAKIFINYAYYHNFLNSCNFKDLTSPSIRYLFEKGYDIQKLSWNIGSIGNIKLIREVITKVNNHELFDTSIVNGNKIVLDFLSERGFSNDCPPWGQLLDLEDGSWTHPQEIATSNLLDAAISENNISSLRWLYEHGAIITQEVIDGIGIKSPNCRKVLEELCNISLEVG